MHSLRLLYVGIVQLRYHLGVLDTWMQSILVNLIGIFYILASVPD